MTIRSYDINLDSFNSTIPEPIIGRQGDKNGAVTLCVSITDRGSAVDLTGQTINLIAETAKGTAIVADNLGVTLTDAVNGKFDYAIPNALWSESGKITKAYFSLNDANGQQTTYDLIFIVKKAIDIDQKHADDYVTIIDGTLRDLQSKVNAIDAAYKNGEFYNKSESDGILGLLSDFKMLGTTVADKINGEFEDRSVNVKWFGAKGDGVNDDTSSIQKAIDTGFSVLLPPGKYNVTELKGFVAGQILQGTSKAESWGAQNKNNITILNGIGTVDNYVIKNNVWGNGVIPTAIAVKNLSIEGNKKTNGILVGNSSSIIDVRVHNCKKGIATIKVSTIENCQISDCDNGIDDATDSRIINNFIYNNGVGINLENSNDNIMNNNKIEWNGIGLSITNGVYNLISSNIFDRNTTYGIYTSNTTNTTVTGNQFERNLTNHLYLGGNQFNISANSFFQKNSEDDQSGTIVPDVAIFTKSISASTITSNTVTGKMFNTTGTDYTSNLNVFGNTINGINPDGINVNVPETTAVHAQDTKIIIPLPTYLGGILSNPYNVEIVSQKILITAQNGNFYSSGGIIKNIYMSSSGIELTVFNSYGDDLKVSGSIKVRCMYSNLY